ncbi:MAG: serine/threonine-protein kinase [Kofleriaceae bacterium]
MTFAPGQTIARFTLVRILGTGGMGEVWEARDDKLARRVAIKVLRAEAGDPSRLVREARALAQVDHPAIVTVYDVGTDAGRVWVAMELLDGGTLRTWLETPRGWREVVAKFIEIGRGLAAAHAGKLVHRDFKPENVLLRSAGAPVVADFGLARATDDPALVELPCSLPASLDDLPTLTSAVNAATLPATHGAISGTPPYMAPEQHLGHAIDARADQFAFAVTLWEALVGRRPFVVEDAGDPQAWALAIIHDRREPMAQRPPVPRWLRALLDRSLATDRDARFPSMDAVVRTLERGLARRRRVLGLGLVTLGLAATVAITATWSGSAVAAPCEGAPARMVGIWDAFRRDELRAAFTATGAAFAGDVFARIVPLLDARRADWIAVHTEACRATNIERTQSPELLDRRIACLDERRTELAALVDALAHPDRAAVTAAQAAIAGLPALARCSDAGALAALTPRDPDPIVQARIDALAGELARAEAIGTLGRYREALALDAAIADEAERLGATALVARARYYEGVDAHHLGDADRAKRALEAATRAAASAHDDALAARAWTELVLTLADFRRVVEADALVVAADAAVRRDRDRPATRALLLQAEGWIALHRGDMARARDRFAAGLALVGPGTSARIAALGNLASVETELADHVHALAHRREVIALIETSSGTEHPLYGESLAELGQAQHRAGEVAAALESLRDAVRRIERAYGPDSPNLAQALHTLANTLGDAKQLPAAVAALERAVAIYEAAKSPRLDAALGSLAGIRYDAGDKAGAIRDMERALPALERRVGRDHFEYAAYESNYGMMVDCAKGLPLLDHAIAVLEKTLGKTHVYTVNAESSRVDCRRELAKQRR